MALYVIVVAGGVTQVFGQDLEFIIDCFSDYLS